MLKDSVRRNSLPTKSKDIADTYNLEQLSFFTFGSFIFAAIGFCLLNAAPDLVWFVYTIRYFLGTLFSFFGIFGFVISMSALIVTRSPSFAIKLDKTWYFVTLYNWFLINPTIFIVSLVSSVFAIAFFSLPIIIFYFFLNFLSVFLFMNVPQ